MKTSKALFEDVLQNWVFFFHKVFERVILLLNLSFHPDQHENLVFNPFIPLVPKTSWLAFGAVWT